MKFFIYFFTILFFVILSSFSSVLSRERVIKPGDALEINVYGSEELNQTVVVKSDGTIDFPSMLGLPLDGIPIRQFQRILVAQLSKYLERTPMVMVRFSESYPIKVTVLGQVAMPGLYPIANTVTLQGAITAAGGFTAGAQLSKIKLIRMEEQNKTETIVNIEKFYENGDPSSLPLLKDGDVIVVSGNPLATNVKVLGCVENPGSYEVSFHTTVLDVIFMAGGATNEANLNKIKMVSWNGDETKEIRLNIKEILDNKAYKNIPTVGPGDVVYIPKKAIAWGRVMGFVRDISTFAMLYYIIVRSRN